MRKTLLVGSLVLSLGLGATAQKFESPVIAKAHSAITKEVVLSTNNAAQQQYQPRTVRGHIDPRSGVSVVPLGTGAMGDDYSNPGLPTLISDPKTNTVLFMHRGDGVDTEPNSRFYDYTTNGTDWTVNNCLAKADDYLMPYAYTPLVALLNPNDSDNPEDLYVAWLANNGNSTNGNVLGGVSGATIKLGEDVLTNENQEEIVTCDEENKPYVFVDFYSTKDKVYAALANFNLTGGQQFLNSIIFLKGEFDAEQEKMVYTKTLIDVPENIWSFIHGPRIAFDPTGQIGYFYSEGNKHDDYVTHDAWPTYIMKTTDGGATWSDVLVIDHNGDNSIAALDEVLTEEDWDLMVEETGLEDPYPGQENIMFGNLWQSDGFVDNKGNLHIACALDAFNVKEGKFYYIPSRESHPLVHIFTKDTDDGSLEIGSELVANVHSREYHLAGGGDQDYHKTAPQFIPTPDRKYGLFMWSDSQFIIDGDDSEVANDRPSIFARGYRMPDEGVEGGFYGESEWDNAQPGEHKVNLTFQTNADEVAWFYNAGTVLLPEGGGSYTVPLRYSSFENAVPNVFNEKFNHHYISGVNFDFEPDGLGDIDASIDNFVKVGQNQPNPFNGETTVNIDLAEAGDLSVEVCDITGQSIQVINKGRVAAGLHQVVIDGSNMAGGIYLYTVSAGMHKVTKKMIVK